MEVVVEKDSDGISSTVQLTSVETFLRNCTISLFVNFRNMDEASKYGNIF